MERQAMNERVKERVIRMLKLETSPPDTHEIFIREALGDLLVYCRDHDIRFEKVLIDAILERID